jgi:hypothetical protein
MYSQVDAFGVLHRIEPEFVKADRNDVLSYMHGSGLRIQILNAAHAALCRSRGSKSIVSDIVFEYGVRI